MAIERISEFNAGDMLLIFEQDTETNNVGFSVIPYEMKSSLVLERKSYHIDNLAQLKIKGDIYPNCYGHGQTMHGCETTNRFNFESQTREVIDNKIVIKTIFKDDREYEVVNEICYFQDELSFEMTNTFINNSQSDVMLEMLSSFEMGNLTPFLPGDGHNSMILHRLRTRWSHEGRLTSENIEDLQLEPSWGAWPMGVEKFGAKGSMPVLKFFPFMAIEDTQNHVLWGVQLANEASWQMEVIRQDDCLHLCGGLADREFGHWMKKIAPQSSFTSPKAIISVCKGDIDEICHRLVTAGEKYVNDGPESEQTLPDAHETEEIPIIAANLHRAILPRQSQIWAVIRKNDSLKRIGYSITNTFLGRMCLSGDVTELSTEQWGVIQRGIDFYKNASNIIKIGKSHRIGPKIQSDRHPEGYQVVLRHNGVGETLIVIHTFNGVLPNEIKINLEEYGCRTSISNIYAYDNNADIKVVDNYLIFKPKENMCGTGIILK